jgi:hypothetical protein
MKRKIFLPAIGACWLAQVASAQFAIDWFSIESGGGASAGGAFTLSASVGNISAGSVSGGDFSFDGGFWALDTTTVTNSPPVLSVVGGPNNTIQISWPFSSPGWILQKTTDLGTAGWTVVTNTPVTNGTTISLTFNAPFSNAYFRLKQ